jgi:hypothetical protein
MRMQLCILRETWGSPFRTFPNEERMPLNLPPASDTVSMLSRSSHLLIPHQQLARNAAVYVQLKAVFGRVPQPVVFYHLTRPRVRR